MRVRSGALCALCTLSTLFVLLAASPAALFAAGSEKVVTTITNSTYGGESWYADMNKAFTAETGIKVSVEVTAGTGEDSLKKQNIELLAGSAVDVIQSLGNNEASQRYDAGFLAPLNSLMASNKCDAQKIWGKYLTKMADGNYYYLPIKQEVNCILYNKKVFDDAGVPYPKAPWTWDDYVATAKKLTNSKKGVWGSYFLDLNSWFYVQAQQKGVPAYRADGKCNFADPAFKSAIKFYYDLGNTYKVQPTIREMKASNMIWNYFATTDKIGMHYTGNWFLRLLNSPKDYPRAWKYGIVATPSAGKGGNNNLGSIAYVSVNKHAAHPQEAFVYASWLARNQWKYERGIPARVDLTDDEYRAVFQSIADSSGGSVTVDELKKALIDNGMGLKPADITGAVGEEYNVIITSEMERYCNDQQSLDDAAANVVKRVDKTIADRAD